MDDARRTRFWRAPCALSSGMLRVEREDRARTTYSEQFAMVVVLEGAFDGWYRGSARTHVAGSLKLKEPGEVHRGLRVHAPFTLQGAAFTRAVISAAADAMGVRGGVHFRAAAFGPGERATRLAFAMHDALVRADATELERTTLVSEALSEVVGASAPSARRAPRAVARARSLLHDALTERVTLDALAQHAGLDKFHLARAFRAEVGLPPYAYLTHLRVARARELLQRGAPVAQAAQAVGFCDESQLHRHFLRVVGVTPGRYARSFISPKPAASREPRALEKNANITQGAREIGANFQG
ncbi:MAG: AraC family transcriptional regulator [Polyangiaceae bacterium]